MRQCDQKNTSWQVNLYYLGMSQADPIKPLPESRLKSIRDHSKDKCHAQHATQAIQIKF